MKRQHIMRIDFYADKKGIGCNVKYPYEGEWTNAMYNTVVKMLLNLPKQMVKNSFDIGTLQSGK